MLSIAPRRKIAVGTTPDSELGKELEGISADVYTIGDAKKTNKIKRDFKLAKFNTVKEIKAGGGRVPPYITFVSFHLPVR